MGEVFLADDHQLERKVAIKFLPDELQDDPVARGRFEREAKSAAIVALLVSGSTARGATRLSQSRELSEVDPTLGSDESSVLTELEPRVDRGCHVIVD